MWQIQPAAVTSGCHLSLARKFSPANTDTHCSSHQQPLVPIVCPDKTEDVGINTVVSKRVTDPFPLVVSGALVLVKMERSFSRLNAPKPALGSIPNGYYRVRGLFMRWPASPGRLYGLASLPRPVERLPSAAVGNTTKRWKSRSGWPFWGKEPSLPAYGPDRLIS